MLEWLIIGGGIHGTHLSLYLTRRKGVPHDQIRVLDPYIEPLTVWYHHAANVGMEFLRSPGAHHLHFDPFSLATFARTREGEPLARSTEPYGRPSLELFRAHSARLIERYRLDSLRVQGRAQKLTQLADGWRVETENGALESRRVVLAIGNTERPFWPDWALELLKSGTAVHHIFEADFDREALPDWEDMHVVGGGITAAQTALALALRQPGTVTLHTRHDLRVHYFDSDTGWIGPDYLRPFHEETDYSQRRATIKQARHRGSMPPDVFTELQAAAEVGLLRLEIDSGDDPAFGTHHGVSLQDTSSVVLATGFEMTRPGGAWLDRAVTEYSLPTAPDGFPLVDPVLCWSPGLYVMGPLAELEVGPVSRNITGARLAAERIGLHANVS